MPALSCGTMASCLTCCLITCVLNKTGNTYLSRLPPHMVPWNHMVQLTMGEISRPSLGEVDGGRYWSFIGKRMDPGRP